MGDRKRNNTPIEGVPIRNDGTYGAAPRRDDYGDEDHRTPVESPRLCTERPRNTGAHEITVQATPDLLREILRDEVGGKSNGKKLPPLVPVVGIVVTLVTAAAGAAMVVSRKADRAEAAPASEVDRLRERVDDHATSLHSLERKTDRIETSVEGTRREVDATRREQRMLIRALRPEVARTLEPLEDEGAP